MDMRRLVPVAGIEEETIWAGSQDGGHVVIMPAAARRVKNTMRGPSPQHLRSPLQHLLQRGALFLQ